MSLLLSRAGLLRPRPASIVFNGTDEYLSRTIASSLTTPTNTAFTVSLWFKAANAPASGAVDVIMNYDAGGGVRTRLNYDNDAGDLYLSYVNTDVAASTQVAVSASDGAQVTAGAWHHLVWRVDSTQGTSDDRIEFHIDGPVQADVAANATELNQVTHFFQDGATAAIGALSAAGNFIDGRLAFIEVVQDQALPASAFAFDNGGTWTRKPYTGSYGTYGLRIDGTSGFDDVSGNGQHFTGNNMTPSANLDYADLPPYVE